MPADLNDNLPAAEFAHILFLDMVGYSRLSMEEQHRSVRDLRDLVRATPQFQRAEQQGDLLRLDGGDGMALLFWRDPLGPIQCATEIGRALQAHPRLQVRMGVHSGPVTRVVDINGNENVSGSGVVVAQRVMACGDSGHILISAGAAEMIREFETWSSALIDLGETTVKHGQRIHLFNLVLDQIGNPARPSKVAADAILTAEESAAAAASSRRRVALLYKRKASDDEHLLLLLEAALKTAGFDVFIDRHLQIGVAWATEIERQIRTSDAVVVLLSESSVRSEMIEHEIQIAHRAQLQNGKPELLPVRVSYEGPLPDALAAVVEPLHYTLWRSEADDARVVREILTSLTEPIRPPLAPERRERAGGAVPLDSGYYIVRPTDEEFMAAIDRQDSIVLVKGGRQMGKTSLLARGLQQARQRGARIVLTDFQALSAGDLTSADTLYRAFAQILADQLDLDVLPDETWNLARGANMNLERYLRREVLGALGGTPLVWGLDEVDKLFTCPFGSEVFGLFRSWHNRRSLDPAGPWSRLTLAIAYATEAHLFITDLNQSPFNVGTRLTLDDFTVAQIAELNRRYGEPLRPEEVQRFHILVGGQPYLARRGFDEFASGLSMADFEEKASRDEGIYGDHLRRLLLSLSQDETLMEVVRGLLEGLPCPSPETFYRLRAAGLVRGDHVAEVQIRCQLYREYLQRHLL